MRTLAMLSLLLATPVHAQTDDAQSSDTQSSDTQSSDTQTGGAQSGDTAPLTDSLRPAERARATRTAGELPRYELALELADDLRSFELDETVTFVHRGARPLSSVVLRVFANAVGESPLVSLESASCGATACRVEQPSPSAFVLLLATPLTPGARFTAQLRLRGRLREIDPSRTTLMGQGLEGLGAITGGHGTGGHGAGDYGLLAHSEGVASMASFFAVLARQRAGRWEQSDASTLGDLGTDQLADVRARVVTSDGVHVVATGIEDAPRPHGSRVEHVVRAAHVRDFALVASRRLRAQTRTVGGVRVRSFYVDGHDAEGAFVLDVAAHALRIFERRFGAYPYVELDVVEAPLVGGAGGVEFSSMVTIANMFYRPAATAPATTAPGLAALLGGSAPDLAARQRSMLEFVTAHEIAHQWWHGLVGSDSRAHPFQDEALAQYSAILYFEERHGAARATREADQQVASSYRMMRLLGRADAAVDRPVAAFPDPLSYSGVVYGKGPYLYTALRRLLGDRRFFAAIRSYADQHRFAIAPPRALFDRMARGRRAPRVRALVRRWLDETHGDEDLGSAHPGQTPGGADPALEPLLRELAPALQGGDSDARLRDLLRQLGGDADAARELRRLLQQP